MTKHTFIAAIAALSLVACARGHKEAVKAGLVPADASVSQEAAKADSKVADATGTSAKATEAKAPQKRVNAIGPDLQCSAEFMAVYPGYAANLKVAVSLLKNELNAMDAKTAKKENTAENSARVLAAYKDLSAMFKDYKATFFPFLCSVPVAGQKNVNFSSAEQQASFDKIQVRVGNTIGTKLVGPQI